MHNIDVTKCGFYHPEHGKECHIALAFADEYTDSDHTYLLCEQNPNCYYKQLQREKQNIKITSALIGIALGLLLGWVFPVEGPIDYVYDDYASQPAHKQPVIAPVQKIMPVFDPETMEEMDEIWKKQHGLDNSSDQE